MNEQTAQIIVGKKAFLDTLNNPIFKQAISNIKVTSSQKELITILNQQQWPYEIVPKSWFQQKFKNLKHQNCCLSLSRTPLLTLKQLIAITAQLTQALIIIVDQIQDPHNLGAILRTAAAVGVQGIILLTRNQVPVNATVLKVSQGMGLLVNIVYVNNLNQALEQLQKAGFWAYASTLSEQAESFQKVQYANKVVLIVGNEARGVSHLLAQKADFHVKIPMLAEVDSLNVAVATGILLYEINRCWNND